MSLTSKTVRNSSKRRQSRSCLDVDDSKETAGSCCGSSQEENPVVCLAVHGEEVALVAPGGRRSTLDLGVRPSSTDRGRICRRSAGGSGLRRQTDLSYITHISIEGFAHPPVWNLVVISGVPISVDWLAMGRVHGEYAVGCSWTPPVIGRGCVNYPSYSVTPLWISHRGLSRIWYTSLVSFTNEPPALLSTIDDCYWTNIGEVEWASNLIVAVPGIWNKAILASRLVPLLGVISCH